MLVLFMLSISMSVTVSVCVMLHMSVITQDGLSALMEAGWFGKTEVVVELAKAGADLNLQNKVRVCQCWRYTYLHVYYYYTLATGKYHKSVALYWCE